MDLHNQLLILRKKEKQISAQFLEVLQKVEDQRGYLKLGYSSLFDYLVRGFGYSESRAYQRQSCLRLSRELPEIKEKIQQGSLSYSTLSLAYKSVRKKSTDEKREILGLIENKSTREVKNILLEPSPPIKIKQQVFQDKVILKLDLTPEQHKKLQKLKALKSHKHTMESLFESLIDSELKKYEKALKSESGLKKMNSKKTASQSERPSKRSLFSRSRVQMASERRNSEQRDEQRKDENVTECSGGTGLSLRERGSARGTPHLKALNVRRTEAQTNNQKPLKTSASNPRYVSRRLRNEALFRANYKCQYPGCQADHFLQIDHIIPVRRGGLAIQKNLQVLCSAHNQMKG